MKKIKDIENENYKNWVKVNNKLNNPHIISVTAFVHNKNGKKLNSFFERNSYIDIENLAKQIFLNISNTKWLKN